MYVQSLILCINGLLPIIACVQLTVMVKFKQAFLVVVLFFAPQVCWGQNVIITGMEDYNFGTYTVGSGDRDITTDVCVGKDSGSDLWEATVIGSGPGGAFRMSDGMGNNFTFNVYYAPAANIVSGVPQNFSGADTTIPLNCDGIDNQSFRVIIPGSVLDSMPAGTYTGFLDITAAP